MANKNYYLSPHSIAITPNSYNNLPDHLIVAIANGTKIRLAGKWENDMNGNKVNIGYTESLDYRTWNITGGQYHLPQSVSASAVFIYIKLLREGATGFVAVSSLDIDIIGQYNGAKGIEQLADASDYYYVKIAKLSAPNDSNLREILEFDTGEQDTDQGRDNTNSGDLDEMFQNNPSYITILKPFFRLFLFNSGKDSYIDRIITTISDKLSDFGTWSNAHGLATTASTASYIATTLATFAEALNSKFLRKDQDDETEFGLIADTLTAKGSVTAASASVRGKVSAGSATVSGSVTAASASVGTLESKNGSSLQGTTKFSPNYTEGVAGGAITHPNTQSTNDAKLQIEYLHVLKKATFESLEINHVEHIAGNLVMSPAKATLYGVKNMDSFYRCYFLASDSDGNTINNTWRKDDQAYCCTFDTATLGVTDENGKPIVSGKTGNHYYWCLVKAVSTSPVSYDGKQCHYIDIFYSSNPLETDYGSDTPWPGDYVVLRGNRTDENRQGTIELNTSPDMKDGRTTPSVRIYNGINSFSIPDPKIDMNPHHVKMLIDELKIVTGGEGKDIKDYIETETDQFHIFETETSDIPTLYNEPFISWSEGERVKYSQSPNNAVVLNKDGRTWRFFKNEVTGEYYFDEFTDPWLLAQHNKITNILDDKVITANEIPDLKVLSANNQNMYNQVVADYRAFDTDSSSTLKKAYSDFISAWTNYHNKFVRLVTSPTYEAPIYFSDYAGDKEEGHKTLALTRNDVYDYTQAYEAAIIVWNSAIANERQSKIGETAAEEAKEQAKRAAEEYVQNNIKEITGESLDNHMKEVVVPEWYQYNFNEEPSVTKGRLESNENGLRALTESYDKTSSAVHGMMTTVNSTWVGSAQTNYIQDYIEENEKRILLYQIKKHATNDRGERLYWKTDADGNRYQTTEVTTEAVAVADYSKNPVRGDAPEYTARPADYLPRMVIANTDQSGLVTKAGFASMFAQTVDADGNIAAIAQMGTYVVHMPLASLPDDAEGRGNYWYSPSMNKFIYLSVNNEDTIRGKYYYVESTASISADNVSIISNGVKRDGTLGNYWSIDEDGNAILGNVFAREVTVQGVVLNLINDLEAGCDRYIPSVKDDKGIWASDDLDVLRCGDVVRIKSLNSRTGTTALRLPYYINNTSYANINGRECYYNQRTYTTYQTGKKHLITPEELRLLINKRLTIIIEPDCGLSDKHCIGGVFGFESAWGNQTDLSNVGNKIEDILGGTPVFKQPTGDINNYARGIYAPGIHNLQFKACLFKDNNDILYPGFAWMYTGRDIGEDTDIDQAWADNGEEDES